MDHIDTVVIGGGVIGIAIARSLAARNHDIWLLEKEAHFGTLTSARNSGVIHAGIYYEPGSLKALFCVAGRDMLYNYAEERDIPHWQCGKLIVATDDTQVAHLQKLKVNAEKNGVTDLCILNAQEARALEPNISVTAALHVPVSGMIDTHAYIESLRADAEAHGAQLIARSPFLKGKTQPATDGFIITVGDPQPGVDPTEIHCTTLINAAGLAAQGVALNIEGLSPITIPQQVLGKGNYFAMNGAAPFKRLIYTTPVPGSSGLHYRPEMPGMRRAIWGPDLEWQRIRTDPSEPIDYDVNPERIGAFETNISSYWAAMPHGKLDPDYAGVRPKLNGISDFVIQTEVDHGVPGYIGLYGIESPGITSSLALGETVARHLAEAKPIHSLACQL